MSAEWTLSDAWVLAAIRVTGTPDAPGSLMDLIAAADALQGLILSKEELEHGVSRLLAAGLVLVGATGFAATPGGRALVAHARGGPVDRMESLLRLLRGLQVEPVPWTLDRQAYEAACLEYRHTFWEAFRRQGRHH